MPVDVALEVVLGFFCCLVGVVWNAGKFLPVKSAVASGRRKYDTLESRPEFQTFNHRGAHIASRLKQA